METETTETLEQSSSSITNIKAAETSLPQVTNTQTSKNLEQISLPPEVANAHEAAPSVAVATDDIASHQKYQNLRGREMRQETAKEGVRNILKVIAVTGKFWYDWENLRSMLSLHLMQVISEYPQAKMTIEEQKALLGETHAELAKKLDDALHRFVNGPPFTLQRLSEIILDARVLYPNLSKLALALEKNLCVTSTLTISTDPYPPSLITTSNGLNKVTEVPNPNPNPNPVLESDTVMNYGAPPVAASADRDEIMTNTEDDVSDAMAIDVETTEKPADAESSPMTTYIVGRSGVLAQPTGLAKL